LPNFTNRSESVLRALSRGRIYQFGWTFPATTRLLLQASLARSPLTQSRLNQPEVIAPRIEDPGLGVNYRAASGPSLAYMQVNTYRGAMSYVTGSHAVKIGAAAVMGHIRREVVDIGSLRYRALNGVPTQVTYLRTPYTTLFHIRPNLGVYAQDQWTVKNLTLNAERRSALRLPSQHPTCADGPRVRLCPARRLGAVHDRYRLEGPGASAGCVL
jgi:hypothetical protein